MATNETHYLDCNGVAFADHAREFRLAYPSARHPGEAPLELVKDPSLFQKLHHKNKRCWRCNALKGYCYEENQWIELEAHHVNGGTKGRSDERCNILMLCHDCHLIVNTPDFTRGQQYWLLWVMAREYVSWLRCAVLERKFLPDLEPIPEVVQRLEIRNCIGRIAEDTADWHENHGL